MRVFMLGWEFPPFISGGLGTACYGLTKGLSAIGVDVLFVLPRPIATPHSTHVTLAAPRPRPAGTASPHGFIAQAAGDGSGAFDHVTFRTVDAGLADPYRSANGYADDWFPEPAAGSPPPPGPPMPAGWVVTEGSRPGTGAPVTPPASPSAPGPGAYGGDLFAEVQRYAALAGDIARTERFDVVHAHDWMTFPAGLAAAGIRGVPLVVHVHSTEHDRSGLHVDQRIYDIERRGMLGAMRVIAVSQMTKNQCVQRYDVPPAKVTVVHNAVEANGTGRDATGADGPAADPDAEADPAPPDAGAQEIRRGEKIVLFLGRLTMQKGPEYFLAAAKRVLGVMDGVKFVMAGSGDLA
ncbi:MAG: hypothetical protein JWO31_1827, partial [Phycisphaerales bacterium]|nr:hypothetical protein [Phycisphaerales bacterium]